MKLIKRTLTAAAGFLVSGMLIQSLQAACPWNPPIYAQVGVSHTYELADAGMICAGWNPTLILPGTQKVISMCVLSPDAPVQVQLSIRNGIWGTYTIPAVGKNVGGTPEAICFEVPAAIVGLRVVPSADSRAEIGVGVVF